MICREAINLPVLKKLVKEKQFSATEATNNFFYAFKKTLQKIYFCASKEGIDIFITIFNSKFKKFILYWIFCLCERVFGY